MNDEQCLLVGALAAIAAVIFGFVTVNQGGQEKRGHGDDQEDEGTGLVNAKVSLGLCFPPDHTRWHYGPGDGPLPATWERHRGSYPYSQDTFWANAVTTPLSDPQFPRADKCWFYRPPADQGF